MYPDETENWNNFSGDDELASAMENWGDSFDVDISTLLSPPGISPDVEGSSDGKRSFPDSFEHNANAGSQVDSDKSIIPPWLRPMMSTSEIQNYEESSDYLIGYSDCNEPNQECQGTADNLGVGFYMSQQKYRRLAPSRRNSPPISSQPNHMESYDGLGSYPTTVNINTSQGRAFESCKSKATYSMLSGETLTPDALANTSQPLRNGIPYEDRCETSTKRNCQEKEAHFEEQPTEIQSNNPANPITDHDVVDRRTHMGGQPCVRSISTQPSSSFSSIENAKLLFDKLIALPLEEFSNPENATSMIQVLTILKDEPSLFSSEQGDQIVELWFDFLGLRESYSLCQMYSQQSFAETVKIRDLVETSGKDEESLKARYEELENNDKELMKQLEAVEKEKAEIAEKRTEKSKLTKDLKEREAYLNKEEDLLSIATAKLQKLSDEWAERQSYFI